MLINFRIENYKSYKEPTVFSMIPGKYRKNKTHVVSKKQTNILKFSSIYGGNASGKSNLIDALRKTKTIISRGKIPPHYENLGFKLDNSMLNKPSNFEYEISIDNKIFAYGFSIDFSMNKLLNEYLYEIKKSSEKCIFDFNYGEKKLEFNFTNVKDSNNRKKIEVYMEDFKDKKNELFLSFLNTIKFSASENWDIEIKKVFNWFRETLTIITPDSNFNDVIGLFENENKNEIVTTLELIKSFDTGISDINISNISYADFVKNMKSKYELFDQSDDSIEELIEGINNLKEEEGITLMDDKKYYRITKEKDKVVINELNFIHCDIDCAKFSFHEESDGTKRLIDLVNILYSSQFKNRVFIVDEINRSLHPNLTLSFINKFIHLSSKTESQLIITSHESSLLDLQIFRQDEIWIVDRDSNGSSNLIPLSKYKIRSDKVLNKDYLYGRYGGIPKILKTLGYKGDLNG